MTNLICENRNKTELLHTGDLVVLAQGLVEVRVFALLSSRNVSARWGADWFAASLTYMPCNKTCTPSSEMNALHRKPSSAECSVSFSSLGRFPRASSARMVEDIGQLAFQKVVGLVFLLLCPFLLHLHLFYRPVIVFSVAQM